MRHIYNLLPEAMLPFVKKRMVSESMEANITIAYTGDSHA